MTLLAALSLGACRGRGNERDREPAKHGSEWGYFSGPVEARWEEDGRTMTLLSELRYTDPAGVVWLAPAGARVDGASIPRVLWSLMGGPFEGKYRSASVLHDVAYDQKNRPPQEVDRMFYNAMRCSGVGAVTAKTMYYALLRHGRHWRFDIRRAKRVLPGEGAEERATAITPQSVDAIEDWVREKNPSLDQIESRATAERP